MTPGGEHDEEDLRDVDWRGLRLVGRYTRCDLSGADLSGVTGGALFEECRFDRAALDGAELDGAAFVRCSFGAVSVTGTSFRDCKLVGTEWSRRCRTTRVVVTGGDWSFVSLRGQDLRTWRLDGVRLVEADLTAADLRGARLAECDASGAVLREAQLAGSTWERCRLEGVVAGADGVAGLTTDVVGAVALAQAFGVRLLG